jgi:hypothetical protein
VELFLVVGPPFGIDAAVALDRQSGAAATRRSRQIVWLPGIEDLPPSPQAYDAFDRVLVHASRREDAKGRHRAGVRGLRQWVTNGGRAVITAGALAKDWLGEDGSLMGFAPGRFADVGELRDMGPLDSYSQPIGANAADSRSGVPATGAEPFRLPIARLENVHGIVESQTGEGIPLVVNSPLGFGEVRFVAFDLDAPALKNWSGHPRLIRRLFELDRGGASGASGAPAERGWRTGGYRDLGEQWRDALDQFDEAPALPFWAIVGAALAYLALIGPIDYFLIGRRRIREQSGNNRRDARPVAGTATWFTSTALVLVATAATFWWRGDFDAPSPNAKAVYVVDVDVAGSHASGPGVVRGAAWINVLAAESQMISMAAPSGRAPVGAPANVRFSSLSPPSPVSGVAILGRNDDPYRVGTERVTHLGLAARSSKLLQLDWTSATTATIAGALAADPFGKPVGKIANPLDEPLTDAVLFYATLAYPLGTLAAKEEIEIGPRRQPVPATAVLNRRRVVEGRETATRYDPTSLDIDRTLEMILFYEAAGGESYTKLKNDVHGRLDMSNQLRFGRAILVCRTKARTTQTSSSIEANHEQVALDATTVYRFVLPVANASSAASALASGSRDDRKNRGLAPSG